ncbi:unnamed protein product [Acanthoscelides obtectus]|uniref:Uncharacterized protein n=1 Tax=Acanthoscelides obtectus TaxID=200917 RepID=A0A9P0JK00_ACAOB|nr:unnamed protein product [Acanthoscelides obtectus]CAK1639760.1 hypothetical protein AOBTE_LOCUS11357 [Acanthoscelides obtectus]
MSVRAFSTQLFKHGKALVRQICKKESIASRNIALKINAAQQTTPKPAKVFDNRIVPRISGLRNVGVQIGLQARRILIDNVLNRVTNSLAADLRKRAARSISGTFECNWHMQGHRCSGASRVPFSKKCVIMI